MRQATDTESKLLREGERETHTHNTYQWVNKCLRNDFNEKCCSLLDILPQSWPARGKAIVGSHSAWPLASQYWVIKDQSPKCQTRSDIAQGQQGTRLLIPTQPKQSTANLGSAQLNYDPYHPVPSLHWTPKKPTPKHILAGWTLPDPFGWKGGNGWARFHYHAAESCTERMLWVSSYSQPERPWDSTSAPSSAFRYTCDHMCTSFPGEHVLWRVSQQQTIMKLPYILSQWIEWMRKQIQIQLFRMWASQVYKYQPISAHTKHSNWYFSYIEEKLTLFSLHLWHRKYGSWIRDSTKTGRSDHLLANKHEAADVNSASKYRRAAPSLLVWRKTRICLILNISWGAISSHSLPSYVFSFWKSGWGCSTKLSV